MSKVEQVEEVKAVGKSGSVVSKPSLASKPNPTTPTTPLSVMDLSIDPWRMRYRRGTTDEKAIHEVWKLAVYRNNKIGFQVQPGDVVLDLGGNIGSFTMYALAHGAARVITAEPHPDNVALLKSNVELNNQVAAVTILPCAISWDLPPLVERILYVPQEDRNTYRHTIIPVRGRKQLLIDQRRFQDILSDDITFVKMDIEGSERAILESCTGWRNVRRLVFEYHFDKRKNSNYKSFERFHQVMNILRAQGFTVHHKPLPLNGIPNYFPCDTVVHCTR
jgi:FkbM family methyltransferase